MQILKKVRKFPCVYWGPAVNTGKELVYPLPVQCKCRWEDEQEVIQLQNGGEYISKSLVLMDRLVDVDGYLFYGSLDDMKAKYGNCVDPREIVEARIIQKVLTIPTLKAKNYTNMKNLAHWAYL